MRRVNWFACGGLCVFVMFCLVSGGCGGNSSSASAADNPAALSAKVESSPSSILLTWNTATLPSGANFIEYNLYRDGGVIAILPASATTYTDSTAATTTSVTYETVPSSPNSQYNSASVTVAPVTTGVAHTYSLTVVYLYSAAGLPQYYETTVGNSLSVTLPTS